MTGSFAFSFLRSLIRHKLYTAINLLGLALGIAVFLTMALIVHYEYTYDVSTPRPDNIFQVDSLYKTVGKPPQEADTVSFVPFPFLKQDFPEITFAIRLLQDGLAIRAGDRIGRETVSMTDTDFFSVFDIRLLEGDKGSALDGPGKVVISADIARKYFGTVHAIGRTMRIDNSHDEAVVSGVLAPQPSNSTNQFDIIQIFPSKWKNMLPFRNWGSPWGTIWLRIDNPQAMRRMNAALISYPVRHPGTYTVADMKAWFGKGGLELIPLRAVHFHHSDIGRGGNSRDLINILGLVGFAALATAIVNYVNLATARSVLRAREVALRKVLGASRAGLIAQFLGEAVMMVAVAVFTSVALTECALRWVNALGGWSMSFDWAFILPVAGILIVVVGIIAGFYPAIVLSSFRPASVLAASRMPAGGRLGSTLRNALVVLQFGFAITLAICTLVMTHQAQFVRELDRGMRKTGLIVIDSLNDESLKTRQEEIMHHLAAVPGVHIATRSDAYPHHLPNLDQWHRNSGSPYHYIWEGLVRPGYFESVGAKLLAGRLLDEQYGNDYHNSPWKAGSGSSVVISRQSASILGFPSPEAAIGQDIYTNGLTSAYRVVGVIEDMRFYDAREAIRPLLYLGKGGAMNFVAAIVQYSGASEAEEMGRLRAEWERVAPDVPFSANSVNDIFTDDYRTDENHGILFGIASALAIGIACLGLYGLSAFNVSRRMYEIGIRKVLGARTRDILVIFSSQFLRPVLIANLIAWPVAWTLMRGWLSTFNQRISLTPVPFIIVAAIAAAIATLTILTQTVRAARNSPATALRQR